MKIVMKFASPVFMRGLALNVECSILSSPVARNVSKIKASEHFYFLHDKIFYKPKTHIISTSYIYLVINLVMGME